MIRAIIAICLMAAVTACTPNEPETVAGDPCQTGEDSLTEGNSEAAIEAFEACLNSAELDPEQEAIIHTRLGGAYLYVDRFEEALQEFNLAYAIADTQGVEFDNPYVRRNRGIARRYVGQLEGALEDLEAAALDLPDDITTQLNLGGVYSYLGREAEAVAAFDAVTRIEPEWPGGWVNLSGALLELGMNDQAIDHARRAVELNPESGFALNALCWALVVDQQFETALPLCDQAVEAEPDNGAIIHSRASALEGVGRMEEARELYARAYELFPDSETVENDYRRTHPGDE
ncbi:tetratricopeptide repeat protein [Hyphobacterium sp. HN65]|uniref:Tetratricopeptide repeat protein n=1 Tax=Hyphobacterium lacteum TaxID=3116575 RepID=A0ABU7LNY7_9PROT|nr:tetratricopeptide repeat protein [Hyphobacterium sp. HN65]MEE2525607.1 tetratricopeptide repeat protein [Hyphobacterium sp. HN65]